MSSKKPNMHFVSPNSERGGWDVQRAGAQRASSHHETQAEAIRRPGGQQESAYGTQNSGS